MDLISLLTSPRKHANASKGPLDPFWYSPVGHKVASGVRVDENTAQNYSAVWCATRFLAETVAQLPCSLHRRKTTGRREKMVDDSRHRMIHDRPNWQQDQFGFFEQMTAWLVNWGDCYAEKERNGRNEAVNLWPIHPSRVPAQLIERDDEGRITFIVLNPDGSRTPIPEEDMLHVTGTLSEDGVTGKGVIRQARESIGVGLATERYGAALFGNGASPRLAIKHPAKLGKEAAENLRNSWREVYEGLENAHKTAILEENMSIEKLGFPPEEAQFLETRKFNVNEFARWYRLPPHVLGDLERSTNNNIEHQGLELVVYSLMPWLVRWEKALNRQLLTEEERADGWYFKFNVMALVRGDAKTRAEFYNKLFPMALLNRNEIRELEDMDPIEGGDTYYLATNNLTPLDEEGLPVMSQVSAPPVAPEPAQPVPPTPEPTDEEASALLREIKATRLEWQREREALDAARAELFHEHAQKQESLRDSVLGAAGLMLQEAFGRMIRKEAQAARRAAANSTEFLDWADSFYGKHVEQVREALRLPAEACGRIGCVVDAAAVAEAHCGTSRAALLAIYDTATREEFQGTVDRLASEWEQNRAEQAVRSLLKKGQSHATAA